MSTSDTHAAARHVDPRTDPARDRRRFVIYAVGLTVFYVGAVLVFHPAVGDEDALGSGLFLGIMLAPTFGALLVRFLGPGVIRIGRPSKWILAGFLPVVAALVMSLLGAAFGLIEIHPDKLPAVLILAVPLSIYGSVAATGEEIGWRGFLWPLLRRRSTFVASSAVMFVVWWIYHAPLVLLGWYGFMEGLPAFTVGLVGFVLFIGVITDRSRSVWPSIVAHGAWNGVVATYFSTTGDTDDGMFTGSRMALGEFGWLACSGMFLLGVLATWWHFSRSTRARS